MCKFFSFVGDGFGNYLYSDWDARKNNIIEPTDSHTWILTNNNIPPEKQDRWSKYEYNPLTMEFTIDEPVEGHDHNDAEQWVSKLDFKTIIPQLIIKPIKNPLKRTVKVTAADIELLKQWASVGASVGASVRASVRASVGASVGDSVWASDGDSVWASVGDSVWASVWASVRAYYSTFFNINYNHDFSSCVELWDRGLVPSFDGKTWRLHSGKKAEIVYEWVKE